jgi:hypothetical protein
MERADELMGEFLIAHALYHVYLVRYLKMGTSMFGPSRDEQVGRRRRGCSRADDFIMYGTHRRFTRDGAARL